MRSETKKKTKSKLSKGLVLPLLIAALLIGALTACQPPPGNNPAGRVHHAVLTKVPHRLRSTINYNVTVINGYTSYASSDGRIQVSRWQMNQDWPKASWVALHEYGHLVAFKHGSGAFYGAGPRGFPGNSGGPEVWGDCFGYALTGVKYRNNRCSESNRRWTANWINTWR